MRVRSVVLMALVALGLVACGGGGSTEDVGKAPSRLAAPTAELTEITIPCAKFAGAARKITDAQGALYSGAGSDAAAAIDTLVEELGALKAGAPAEVRDALTRMAAAFGDARELLAKPTAESRARLAALASTLSADGQRITAYVTSRCG